MVKAIIFDCFGVLTTDYWKEFTAKLTPEKLEQARGLMYQYDSGRIERTDFLSRIEEVTGQKPHAIEQMLWGERVKNEELLDYIRQLKTSCKIGLLSNIGSNWIRQTFLTEDEQALFDDMVLSYEVKLAKPDPEIFELAAERLGVKPAECVMVDDSEGHCSAAARAGMKFVYYENLEQLKRDLAPLLNQS
jgi:HAD superfamily hydrolase (TIGR01509 family)